MLRFLAIVGPRYVDACLLAAAMALVIITFGGAFSGGEQRADDGIDALLMKRNAKLGGIDKRMNMKGEKVEGIEKTFVRVGEKLDKMGRTLDSMRQIIGRIEEGMGSIVENRHRDQELLLSTKEIITGMQRKVDALEATTKEGNLRLGQAERFVAKVQDTNAMEAKYATMAAAYAREAVTTTQAEEAAERAEGWVHVDELEATGKSGDAEV